MTVTPKLYCLELVYIVITQTDILYIFRKDIHSGLSIIIANSTHQLPICAKLYSQITKQVHLYMCFA